jgi:Ca2+-binding EF-hand superfamily protein
MINNRVNDEILKNIREQIRNHGARGFIGLQRKFRIIDDDGSKSLDFNEFRKGILESKIILSDSDMKSIFDYFDKDHNGSLNFDEFLIGMRVSWF